MLLSRGCLGLRVRLFLCGLLGGIARFLWEFSGGLWVGAYTSSLYFFGILYIFMEILWKDKYKGHNIVNFKYIKQDYIKIILIIE